MKGPNPFAVWDDIDVCGRKDESKIFNSFENGTTAKQAGFLLVVAGVGCGKTTMLRFFRAEAEKNGMLAIYVKIETGEHEKELVRKIYDEANLMTESVEIRPKPKHKISHPPENFTDLAEALEKLDRKRFGVMVFVDDIDLIRKSDNVLNEMIKSIKNGWGRRKVSLVVSSTQDLGIESEVLTKMALRPFDEHDSKELVEKALKKGPPKMGDECLNAILNDSGGNPKMIKMICRSIFERIRDTEKIISKGHYLGYMPQIMSVLSREWFGGVYQKTPGAERAILVELAHNENGMHVSEIAKRMGKPLGPVTSLIKRLLNRGQIIKLDRGKYRIFSRLYGKYIITRN